MKQPRYENQQAKEDAQAPLGHGDGGCPMPLGVGTKGEKRGRHEGVLGGVEAIRNLILRALEKVPLKRQKV